MKKRFWAILAALVLAVSVAAFTACGGTGENGGAGAGTGGSGTGGSGASGAAYTVKAVGAEQYTLASTLTGRKAETVQTVETHSYQVVDVFIYTEGGYLDRGGTGEVELTNKHFVISNANGTVNPDYIYTDGKYYSITSNDYYNKLDLSGVTGEASQTNTQRFGIAEADLATSATYSYHKDTNGSNSGRKYSLIFKSYPKNITAGTASINFRSNGVNGGRSQGIRSVAKKDNRSEMGQYDQDYKLVTSNDGGSDYSEKSKMRAFLCDRAESGMSQERYEMTSAVHDVTYGESGTYTEDGKTVKCPSVTIAASNSTFQVNKFTLVSGETTLTAKGTCDGQKNESNDKKLLGDVWNYYKVTTYKTETVKYATQDVSVKTADGDKKIVLYFGDEIPQTYTLYYDGTELKA